MVLSANKNYKKLAFYAKKLRSKYAVIKDKRYYSLLKSELGEGAVKELCVYITKDDASIISNE